MDNFYFSPCNTVGSRASRWAQSNFGTLVFFSCSFHPPVLPPRLTTHCAGRSLTLRWERSVGSIQPTEIQMMISLLVLVKSRHWRLRIQHNQLTPYLGIGQVQLYQCQMLIQRIQWFYLGSWIWTLAQKWGGLTPTRVHRSIPSWEFYFLELAKSSFKNVACLAVA